MPNLMVLGISAIFDELNVKLYFTGFVQADR